MFARLVAIAFLSASVLAPALAQPKPGGAPRGGTPRGGGMPHVGGAPHAAPRMGGGPHLGGAAFGGAPRAAAIRAPSAARFAAPRLAAPRLAARPFARAHAARLAVHPMLPGRTASRIARPRIATQPANRSAFNARALDRNAAGPSNRNTAGVRPNALRSAPVRGQNPRGNAFALRAFSGASARAEAGRMFRDPAFARHRFDPAFFARFRFAGAFWPGPFFWPYAYYDDAFWFWPSAYDDVFWTYGYDDILRGVYSPYAFSDYDEFLEEIGRPLRHARGVVPPRDFNELCGEAAPGLTDWPADQIVATVQPNNAQRALLDALVRASDQAAEGLRAACPRSVAVTPVGRLDALEKQLAALQAAVRGVRPPLEKFYDALSDDQKQRFNTLAPATQPTRSARGAAVPQADRLAQMCQATAQPDWPAARIEEAVRPNEQQRAALQDLHNATAQAARIVRAACPTDLPLTPPGRLAAMEGRIDALHQGAETLRPALTRFYALLNDEQKARLNRVLSAARRTG